MQKQIQIKKIMEYLRMALIPNSAVNRQEGFENLRAFDFFGRGKPAASKLDRKLSSDFGGSYSLLH